MPPDRRARLGSEPLTRSPRPPYAARMAKKKAKAKPGRGGARAGAGRPVSTGMGSVKAVSFKLLPDDRERADSVAKQRGMSVGELAREALLGVINPRFE